ncbi:MAG: GSCFA domain-containing protein [Candidatus Eremiobacteraeota bacterium]|nr:GSCFA domain-containing protein [Candidatus Eremiobacteraeota bacterium]
MLSIGVGTDGETAWARSLAEPHAVWDAQIGTPAFPATVRGRLAAGFATPHVVPKFPVRHDDAFFCIGSCFARVIERQLRYRNLNVLSMRYHGELTEAQLGPNGANKFTTASMLNELKWSLAGEPFPDEALVPDGDGYRDLQLAEAVFAVSPARARERRAELLEYFGRLKDADVVVITLGLVEVWYDHLAQLYLNVTPPLETARRFPGRFSVHTSDYAENRARLAEIVDLLTTHGRPGARIVVTVSPVPLQRTFGDVDVLSANVYAKSTLRAVAGDLARERANVQYFPSYELVTVTDRNRAFAPDQAHVTEEASEEIVRAFAKTFGLAEERPHPEFREKEYLWANPDVPIAVTEGGSPAGTTTGSPSAAPKAGGCALSMKQTTSAAGVQPGDVFNLGESSFNVVQGVTEQLVQATWFRGQHCNFNPTKADLLEPGALERHVTQGWLPETPFITRAHGITAFGSCFAENITRHLGDRAYRVLTDQRHADVNGSYVIRCAEGIVNTFAVRQQFEWALNGAHFNEELWFDSKGVLAPYNERVRHETAGIFTQTDVFIITAGLAEVWYSTLTGEVFWRAVPADQFDPARHGFRLSSVAENLENLTAIRALIRAHRPEAAIVFTLSPIPLHATFRPISCITANAVSKATLRVALDELMRAHGDDQRLFYFPAYEIVRDAFADPFVDDNRHVKPHILDAVAQTFERAYCLAEPALEPTP